MKFETAPSPGYWKLGTDIPERQLDITTLEIPTSLREKF